ncbi:Fe-S cluster biogenesis protein NfuA, 4Fe-4S-binding domain [Modestobacter sp. DSM 44400]|uniref:NifU family protein n=1 Tax=Modestobacter sp. DSM 44400 TaxID=1550230 RepID=UPI0008989E10|nr:NifU family protein [Modestobacter sp. DSM 44400]SDX91521.1 Fe-S cluster biogenesis protein NfuA, 4Fe-4S-binding domain [Modestobacter sp. DSM 44400]
MAAQTEGVPADHGPPDWRAAGERIDTLIDASASGGAVARERTEELVRLVADLYGAGLERVLDIVHDLGHLDDVVLDALAKDDLVASLLLVHGLHPYDVVTRVEQALDSVRPYLGSHGGDVELLEVTEDDSGEVVVRLRLLGSCDGCPSSSVTLKLAVEGAIEAAAPEITTIEVETATEDTAGPVIPVESLRARLGSAAGPQTAGGSSWQPIPELDGLPSGGVTRVLAGSVPIVACRIGADLFAFRDRCARCEQSMGGAVLARRLGGATGDAVLRCPSCAAHYDVRRAGVCLDAEGLHLAPLPLLADGVTVSVAVPFPVAV